MFNRDDHKGRFNCICCLQGYACSRRMCYFFNPIISIITELCGTPGYLAPEVLAVSMYEGVSGYRHEVDMWAIGVIMYTLLCGAPPFWHRKQMQMLRMIMQANYSFGTPEWDDISQPPKDLV